MPDGAPSPPVAHARIEAVTAAVVVKRGTVTPPWT
jgi:hypothetical protein